MFRLIWIVNNIPVQKPTASVLRVCEYYKLQLNKCLTFTEKNTAMDFFGKWSWDRVSGDRFTNLTG